jgi:hypothetical protein
MVRQAGKYTAVACGLLADKCSCIICISAIHGGQPVFGNICSNKRLNRISLRGEGEVKSTAQWLLYCMLHNIEKLWKNTEIEQWA